MDKIIFKNDNFALVEEHGIGIEDTPFTKLEVESKGKARKHVVEISLFSDSPDFEGKPVQYRYVPEKTYVNHGMRMKVDTLEETLEYVAVLKDAVEFAKRVNTWLFAHPEWKWSSRSR